MRSVPLWGKILPISTRNVKFLSGKAAGPDSPLPARVSQPACFRSCRIHPGFCLQSHPAVSCSPLHQANFEHEDGTRAMILQSSGQVANCRNVVRGGWRRVGAAWRDRRDRDRNNNFCFTVKKIDQGIKWCCMFAQPLSFIKSEKGYSLSFYQ